jgi:hypothetical protein
VLPKVIAERIGTESFRRWGAAMWRKGRTDSELSAAMMRRGEVMPDVQAFLAETLQAPWATFATVALLDELIASACTRAGWPMERGRGSFVFVPIAPTLTRTFATSPGEPVNVAMHRLDQFYRDIRAEITAATKQAKAWGRNPGAGDNLKRAGRWLYERGVLKHSARAIALDWHESVKAERKAHPQFSSCGCYKDVRDALKDAESYLKLPSDWKPEARGD